MKKFRYPRSIRSADPLAPVRKRPWRIAKKIEKRHGFLRCKGKSLAREVAALQSRHRYAATETELSDPTETQLQTERDFPPGCNNASHIDCTLYMPAFTITPNDD